MVPLAVGPYWLWQLLWTFLLIFLLSYVLNDYTWEDLVNLFNVMFVFLVGILVASSTDSTLIARNAGAYADKSALSTA